MKARLGQIWVAKNTGVEYVLDEYADGKGNFRAHPLGAPNELSIVGRYFVEKLSEFVGLDFQPGQEWSVVILGYELIHKIFVVNGGHIYGERQKVDSGMTNFDYPIYRMDYGCWELLPSPAIKKEEPTCQHEKTYFYDDGMKTKGWFCEKCDARVG